MQCLRGAPIFFKWKGCVDNGSMYSVMAYMIHIPVLFPVASGVSWKYFQAERLVRITENTAEILTTIVFSVL